MMKHAMSESDVTSLATTSSPPRTPPTKRPAYYVQSPSRDSHDDGDKSSTSHATPIYSNSPLESPSHPSSSTGRHSRISSSSAGVATRYSGFLRSSPSSPGGRKRRLKGWREVDAIDEESDSAYDDETDHDQYEEREVPCRFCVLAFWLAVLVLLFAMACLIVWGVARRYEPSVIVKSLTVHNLYVGQGTDSTGVPTKLATLNCTLSVSVHNPSTMSGIHVSSSYTRLMYSEISVADGQLDRFYQPRTSHRVASVVLHGEKTPLYGAGATLDLSNSGAAVPLTLELGVRTRGYVIGELVRVSHAKHVKCPVVISSGSSKPVRFTQSACTYT